MIRIKKETPMPTNTFQIKTRMQIAMAINTLDAYRIVSRPELLSELAKLKLLLPTDDAHLPCCDRNPAEHHVRDELRVGANEGSEVPQVAAGDENVRLLG